MTKKVMPIRPGDVAKMKGDTIPDAVIRIFNELIAENICKGRAVVKQEDVLTKLAQAEIDQTEAFKRGWLDVVCAHPSLHSSGKLTW